MQNKDSLASPECFPILTVAYKQMQFPENFWIVNKLLLLFDKRGWQRARVLCGCEWLLEPSKCCHQLRSWLQGCQDMCGEGEWAKHSVPNSWVKLKKGSEAKLLPGQHRAEKEKVL